MAQGNLVETVQRLYGAFGQGDIETVMNGLDAEITWVNPGPAEIPYFGTHQGRQAVLQNIFGFLGQNIDIQVFQPTSMLAQDDKVVVLLDMELAARATGKKVVQKVAHVWTFKDGRPVHFHDFQNSYAIAAALRG
jgi:ketosteroid isomerase-like protein